MLLSQAPGLGGGEKLTLTALARSARLEIIVLAHREVCEFARKIGLRAFELEFPWVHRLRHLPLLLINALRLVVRLRRLGVDLLYANGTRAITYGVAARAFGGPKLVVHHHGLFRGGPIGLLLIGVRRWGDLIIVPSTTVARYFRDSKRFVILANGVDIDHFRPPDDRAIAKKKLGFEGDRQVIGTVGRTDIWKGMLTFVRVAGHVLERSPGTQFLIVGGAVFPHETRHFEMVWREALAVLDGSVLMTGQVDDIKPCLEAMDVFVHLGYPEGFGLAAVEAMSTGVPVVAYEWGGLAEIVESGSTGLLVEPHAEEKAASAILELVSDPARALQMGKRARAQCESKYSMDRYAAELENHLLEVLTSGGANV